jgi:hypothetical protein
VYPDIVGRHERGKARSEPGVVATVNAIVAQKHGRAVREAFGADGAQLQRMSVSCVILLLSVFDCSSQAAQGDAGLVQAHTLGSVLLFHGHMLWMCYQNWAAYEVLCVLQGLSQGQQPHWAGAQGGDAGPDGAAGPGAAVTLVRALHKPDRHAGQRCTHGVLSLEVDYFCTL